MNKRVKENGITLIALVVTIVVLLILAGVSISMLTGNNGIITQAQNAKNKTEEAEEKEKIQLAVLDAISKENDLTEENLQEEIDDEFGSGETKVYPNEEGAFTVIFQNKDTNYRIEEDGTVTKIDIAFKIRNEEELKEFMNEVNNGNSYENQYVYLLEDIDLNNEELDVIGSYTDDSNNKEFAGIFEGNNKTISNININKSEEENIGLFAYNTGIIRNLKMEGGSITGSVRVGGIVSINKGTIENCHNNGVTINSTSTTGGGGIAASNRGGTITYCSNSSNIVVNSASFVGGIVGGIQNNATVSYCYNTGNVEADSEVGGIVGGSSENSKILNSYNVGNIKGIYNAGGIAGTSSNTEIRYSFNNGYIEGTGVIDEYFNTNSAGIVGSFNGKVISCYNTGTVKGKSCVGGVVGQSMVNEEIQIVNCYNIGCIEKTENASIDIGNIIGGAYGNRRLIIKNNYFSREISNIDGVGAVGPNAQIEIMETIEKDLNYMKTNSFVKDLNKDEEVFTLGGTLNNGYPILNWQ